MHRGLRVVLAAARRQEGCEADGRAGIAKSKLSTVKRPDGKTQVTYAGFPLYRYAADKKPGDVKGQGFEKIWYAVTAKGTLAKAGATPAATTADPDDDRLTAVAAATPEAAINEAAAEPSSRARRGASPSSTCSASRR